MVPIHEGDKGLSIGRIQQFLIESNYPIHDSELQQMLFGKSTLEAVKAFQASHLGPTGHPLVEDGIVGDQTSWALMHPGGDDNGKFYTVQGWRYDLTKVRSEVARLVQTAISEIGTCEKPDGSNDGTRIRCYTAPDFIGSPWCMLFLSYCFKQGLDSGSPFGRIAAVWALYEWAQEKKRVLPPAALPQAGDVFVVLRGDQYDTLNHRGHCGLIVHVLDDGRLCTVAGNESNAVRGAIRNRNDVSAILRPVPLV